MHKNIRDRATIAWRRYGDALRENFEMNSWIDSEPLVKILEEQEGAKSEKFIEYLEAHTRELQKKR